ncbi:uncharacterized protein [Physcomitrium patens]|uniref:uncharacterized protein isoform X2 n=1 Tax=Physcomitrium patens TaxID=3218 RepID=UPI003CCCEC98
MATLQRRRCPRILAHAGTIVMLLLLELLSPALSLVVNGTIFKCVITAMIGNNRITFLVSCWKLRGVLPLRRVAVVNASLGIVRIQSNCGTESTVALDTQAVRARYLAMVSTPAVRVTIFASDRILKIM